MTAYVGELAPAAPSPGKVVVGATTDVTDEVANAAGQVLTPAEERESSSLMDGSFSLLGGKNYVNKTKTRKECRVLLTSLKNVCSHVNTTSIVVLL